MLSWSGVDMVFLISAIVGGLSFSVWLLLQFVGGGHFDTDVDMDAGTALDTDLDVSGEADVSFTLLSFQGIAAFFTMFGLVGLAISRESSMGQNIALIGGLAAGLVMTWAIGRLFRLFASFQSSGTVDIRSAVGVEGEVYLRIPEGGTGKIRVTVQGRLMVLEASSNSHVVLESGKRVRVVEVIDGHVLVVQPVSDAS